MRSNVGSNVGSKVGSKVVTRLGLLSQTAIDHEGAVRHLTETG